MSSEGMETTGIMVMEPWRSVDAPAALVDLGQVRVEVAGIALARRHVALGGGHLAQGLGVVGHVGHDHQHVRSRSKARYSAAVRAVRGRVSRSTGGSSARLMNMTTLRSTPELANSSWKNLASA